MSRLIIRVNIDKFKRQCLQFQTPSLRLVSLDFCYSHLSIYLEAFANWWHGEILSAFRSASSSDCQHIRYWSTVPDIVDCNFWKNLKPSVLSTFDSSSKRICYKIFKLNDFSFKTPFVHLSLHLPAFSLMSPALSRASAFASDVGVPSTSTWRVHSLTSRVRLLYGTKLSYPYMRNVCINLPKNNGLGGETRCSGSTKLMV